MTKFKKKQMKIIKRAAREFQLEMSRFYKFYKYGTKMNNKGCQTDTTSVNFNYYYY